jgi:hypothetical protein
VTSNTKCSKGYPRATASSVRLIILELGIDVDGGASNSDDAAEVVVIAADSLPRAKVHKISISSLAKLRRATAMDLPRVSWDADDTDGAAGDTNVDIEVLDDDAQKPEEEGRGRIIWLGGLVAALDGTSRARGCGGCGDGSGGKSQSGEELELHVEDRVVGLGW